MNNQAFVFVSDVLAATLTRTNHGIEFKYLSDYDGQPIATTLPVETTPQLYKGGALPPFFTGLLPEGRRLSTLKRQLKTSADDELSLLLGVGTAPVGNVRILPTEKIPPLPSPLFTITADDENLDFSAVLSHSQIPDPFAIAGAQDKASARTIAIPVTSKNADAILKLSPPEYPQLVENEYTCIETISAYSRQLRHELVNARIIHDKTGRSGLLVSRFDSYDGHRIPVEDGAQILGIYPADKYNVSYEEIAFGLAQASATPIVTLRSVALQVALAWLSGNGDLHAKNFSLYNKGNGFEPTPIYDIPSTLIYGDNDLALSVGGSRKGLSKKRFLTFGKTIGLPEIIVNQVADAALNATEQLAENLLANLSLTTRQRRDIPRILHSRRKAWL